MKTQVLAQWRTLKPVYRVSLEDGTQLETSADHRFLTLRGWKYVTGSEHGATRRPHLTLNDKLMGFGGVAPPPALSADYKRGYLAGMIRGDALLKVFRYERAGRRHGDQYQFRLALADTEALDRVRQYLGEVDVPTRSFSFLPPRRSGEK